MSYIVNKFNNGEVKFQNGAAGWLFDSGEFRPLMNDAMQELLNAGLVDQDTVKITAEAREISVFNSLSKAVAQYIEAQKNRTPEQIAEERFEARAAFGPGEKMVNVLTGEIYYT